MEGKLSSEVKQKGESQHTKQLGSRMMFSGPKGPATGGERKAQMTVVTSGGRKDEGQKSVLL